MAVLRDDQGGAGNVASVVRDCESYLDGCAVGFLCQALIDGVSGGMA